MKIFLFSAALLLTLQAAAVPKPLLSVDFDGNLGGGKSKGRVAYVPGVRGKAVKLSDGQITYPKLKKLTADEGTITIWIKPDNWKWSKKNFINFLNSGRQYTLYKFHLPLGLLMNYGKSGKYGKQFVYVNQTINKLPDDSWMALGATWSQKQHLLALYLNGEKIRSTKIPEGIRPDDPLEWLVNGPAHNPNDRKNTTLFDMLRIYDKALTEKEMEEVYTQERPEQVAFDPNKLRPFRFNLPQLKSAPKIDGNVDEREWESAAKLGGFSSASGDAALETAYPSDAYVGYYKDKLYACFVFTLPGATQITTDKVKRDSPVCYDDSAEFLLRPFNMKKGFYQGIFNSKNVIFDQQSGKLEWDGKWEVNANVYEGMLNIEIAMPASELNTVFKDGSVWNMNFARNRIVDRSVWFSTVGPFRSGEYFSIDSLAKIVAAGLSGRLTIDYQQLFYRKLELSYQVNNRSKSSKKVHFEVELLNPEWQNVEKKVFTAEIPAAGMHRFTYRNPLNGLRGALVRLTAREDKAAKPFYVHDLPLGFKDEFRIFDETNLKNNTLTLNVDCTSHRTAINAASVTGTLGGRKIKFTGLPQAKGVFNLVDLKKGDYTIELVFKDKTGKEILRHKRPYNHIGQPEWLKKFPGTNAGVVWPYTPLKLKNACFEVWGRTHKFGKNLLPESIVSQKVPLFAAAPTLHATVDGKKYTVNNFKFKVLKNKADKAVMALEGSAGKVRFKGTATLEFDGLIWYEIDMTGPKNTTVSGLRLDIPLAADIAARYNAHYFARERSGGWITPSMTLKRYPSLWMGNDDVGFSFMLESYKSWRNKDINNVFEFNRRGKAMVFTAKMIERPVKLDRPFHYGFGIEANPVKPNPSWYRSWRIGPHKPQNILHPWAFDRANTKKYPGWGGFYTPIFKTMDTFRGLLKKFRAQGVEFPVYLNPGLVSTDSTEFKVFRKEWTNPYNCYPMCPQSTFTHFIASCINDLIKNDLKMIYVDSLGSVNCYNVLHNCGYIDEETGETALTWPIRAMRSYMQRLYSMLHPYDGRNQREYFIWGHTSARNCAAINAFIDATIGGEEQEQRSAANPNYLELYPLEEFNTYYNHTLSGVGMMNGTLGRIGDKSVRLNRDLNDQVTLLQLIHDVQTWPLYTDFPYINKLYVKLDNWGYKNENLKFYSYRKQRVITSPAKDVHISYYQLPDRVLAVIGNWQKKDRTVQVNIDKKALKMGDDLSFVNLRNDQPVDLQKVELRSYNFILLDIRKK